MSAAQDTLTKLTAFDRMWLTLMGLVVILGLGALLSAPLIYGGCAAALYAAGVQLYGRRPRARDLPETRLGQSSENAALFDQRAIADSLTEAVWIVNAQENIVYANDAATTVFGEAANRRLAVVLRDPDVTQMVKSILTGTTPQPLRYKISSPIERHFRVIGTKIDIAPPEAMDEKPRRFAMLVFYDITDLVKFTMTQGDFLANASHELKTPIASLLGYIETLRGHAKDDPQARDKFLAIMQEQAERMQRLIGDLLSLRQIEQSEHIAPTQSADIHAAAKSAIDAVSPLAKTRGVTVTIDGPPVLAVKGHQDQLVQLCLNLVDNAVKMTPKNGSVALSLSEIQQWRALDFMESEFLGKDKTPYSAARQIISPEAAPQGYAVLRIKDTGPGFAKEHIPRLGERFYRIAGDRSSKNKGTGLGLAIVKHLVLRHRGGLWVGSTQSVQTQNTALINEGLEDSGNSGTTFILTLPLDA